MPGETESAVGVLVKDLRVEIALHEQYEQALGAYSEALSEHQKLGLDDARERITIAYNERYGENPGKTLSETALNDPEGKPAPFAELKAGAMERMDRAVSDYHLKNSGPMQFFQPKNENRGSIQGRIQQNRNGQKQDVDI